MHFPMERVGTDLSHPGWEQPAPSAGMGSRKVPCPVGLWGEGPMLSHLLSALPGLGGASALLQDQELPFSQLLLQLHELPRPWPSGSHP